MKLNKALLSSLAISTFALSAFTFSTGMFVLNTPLSASTNELDLGYTSHASNYLIGRSAARLNDYKIGAQFYGRAYEDNPSDQILLERAFVLYVTSGNFERSLEMAKIIVVKHPSHQLARFVLGLNETKNKKYTAARKHFELAASNRIGELTASVLIAWTYAGQSNAKEAYKALDRLDAQGNLNKFKQVHKALVADYLKDSKTAEKSFLEADSGAGNSLQFANAYGSFLWRKGDTIKARVVFTNYINSKEHNPVIKVQLAALNAGKPAPTLIATPGDGMFEVLFALAGALSDKQNATVALIYGQLSLFLKPKSSLAHILLGETYQGIKQYKNAIEAFKKVDPQSPLASNVDIQIASNLDDIDKTEEALKRLNSLIAREPQNFNAWSTKGSILYGREKWDEAAEALSLALARIKEKKRQHWAVYYYRGMSFERAGKWDRAEPDLQMALKLRPAQPAVLNYLGYSWIDRGENLEKAMKMVKQAADLRPRDGYIIDSVGWAHYRLGQYEEAVKRLEQAVRLLPGDPTVNDHLGDAYWRVGRKLEAGFQWAHARDLKPTKKALVIILNKIKTGLKDKPNKS